MNVVFLIYTIMFEITCRLHNKIESFFSPFLTEHTEHLPSLKMNLDLSRPVKVAI